MRHRRFTSWLVVFALLAGTMLPVHAGAHAWRSDIVGRDLCTTSGSKNMPVVPDRAHADACVTCLACADAIAPGTSAGPASFAPGAWLPIASAVPRIEGAMHGRALARGPPLAA